MNEKIFSDVMCGINKAMENSKAIFFCPNCIHKNVCKKLDETGKECADFMSASTYKQYGSVYSLFQPVFEWIKFHYPAGEVRFIVDHNSARMMIDHGPFVLSKELASSFPMAKADAQKEENNG